MLATAFEGGEIAIFSTEQASNVYESQCEDDGSFFTAFSAAGALSIRKRQNRVFQFNNQNNTPEFKQTFPSELCCACIAPLEYFLGTTDGRVHFYAKSSELLKTSKIHSREILCMQFEDGVMATSSVDGTVAYCLNGERVATLYDHFLPVHAVFLWRQYVVSCGDDKKVRVSEPCYVDGKLQLVVRQCLEFEFEVRCAAILGDCIIISQQNSVISCRLLSGRCHENPVDIPRPPVSSSNKEEINSSRSAVSLQNPTKVEITRFPDSCGSITVIESQNCSTSIFVGFSSGELKVIAPGGGISDIPTHFQQPISQLRLFAIEFKNCAEFKAQLKTQIGQDFTIQPRHRQVFLPERVNLVEIAQDAQKSENTAGGNLGVSRAEFEEISQRLAIASANFK